KARELVDLRARDHAVRNVEVGETIVVEVPGIARPRPPAGFDSRAGALVFKLSRALIAEKGVAPGVLAEERADALGRVLHEQLLHSDALAGGRPHVRDVQVLVPIVVVVEPADAHAGAEIFNPGFPGNVGESAVTVVAIEVFPSKIVGHVEVGPAVVVVVCPSAGKAEAIVVLVETRLGGHVGEGAVAVVVEQEIRRAVLGVVIRRRISVAVESAVIAVKAKVDVEPAVAVVVGEGAPGKGSLRFLGELEGLRFQAQLTVPLVQEKERSSVGYNNKVL